MALVQLLISEAHVYPYHMQTVSVRSIVTDYEIMGLPTEKKDATFSEGNNFISFNGAHTHKNFLPAHKNLLPSRRNGHSDSPSERTERQQQFQRAPKSKSFPSTEKKLKSCCKSKTTSPYKKQVHFADMFGYPLAKEFSYKLDQEVEIISRVEVQSLEWSQPEGFGLRKKPDIATEVPKRTQPEVQFMFSQPSSELDFFSKVEHNNVCLENMKREGPCIQGYVRVTNLDYHKKVQVRWTSDAWHSHQDIPCVYSHTIQDSNTDCFSFKLPISGEQMELAIQYSVNGQSYWDNNGGRNYKITIKR